MKHTFHPSTLDTSKCNQCKRVQNEHSCEVCSDTHSDVHIYMTLLMCDSCFDKEKEFQVSLANGASQRVNTAVNTSEANRELAESNQIDASVVVRTDLFNAATKSILDLKSLIDADETITNKPYALASALKDRFNAFKNVVFELNAQIVEASNQQIAIQRYLNDLSNKLRAEEREKLKISDINYKPKDVKPIKVTSIKTAKNKLDKVELRKYASQIGVPEYMLQMIVVSKGLSIQAAAKVLQDSIAAGKSK